MHGRQTFLDLRGYWRDLADAAGVSDYLNEVHVCSTLADPEWDHRRCSTATWEAPRLEALDVKTFRSGIRLLSYRLPSLG